MRSYRELENCWHHLRKTVARVCPKCSVTKRRQSKHKRSDYASNSTNTSAAVSAAAAPPWELCRVYINTHISAAYTLNTMTTKYAAVHAPSHTRAGSAKPTPWSFPRPTPWSFPKPTPTGQNRQQKNGIAGNCNTPFLQEGDHAEAPTAECDADVAVVHIAEGDHAEAHTAACGADVNAVADNAAVASESRRRWAREPGGQY